MDLRRLERLMEANSPARVEDILRESWLLLEKTTEANDKASLLVGVLVSYVKLGRFNEAHQTLDELRKLHISELEVLLNAEFCEPTLLMQEGHYEEGLLAFTVMLNRHKEVFGESRFRYLYEDIQCRRALMLVGLSRFKEALPILQEAVSFSFDTAIDQQQVHFALGACLQDINDPDAAKQEFNRVVGYGVKNDLEEQALYRLAILHYNAGAFAQARHQLETILRNFPSQNTAVPRKQVYQGLSKTCRYLGDSANEKVYTELAKKL